MMGVYIRGKEMPNVCAYCFLDASECDLHPKVNIWRERHPDCPLVELPPHGRLIDADAHILEIRKRYCEDCSLRKGIKNGKMRFLYEIGGVVCRACDIEDMLDALDDAPTVIEAEGETE